jgi:putative ABC transport system substrate-binding protein
VKRRAFITLLGGAAAGWPLAARAQQPERMRRIGVLMDSYAPAEPEGQLRLAAFQDQFRKLGWTAGRNILIETRWAAGEVDRARAFAAELVGIMPDVILCLGVSATGIMQQAARTVPIVFVQVSDPVGSGFVSSLARPGGNITGFSNFQPEISGKWLGLLKEAAPSLSRVAVPFDPETPNSVAFLRVVEAVAPSLGIRVTSPRLHDGVGIEASIARFASEPDGGLIVTSHPTLAANRGSIIALAARYRLPAIYPFRYYAIEGGLMTYGPDQIDQWRGAARYVDRILKGEKPADLPVQAPTKYELVINMKAAKAIGLAITPALPLRADEVIE